MSINWYPGHMHKATGEMRKLLPEIDIIIEVLDARIPYSSQNPVIAQFAEGKPQIKLLNKSDLADPAITELWIEHFNQAPNTRAMAIHQQQFDRIANIMDLCLKLAPPRSEIRPSQALITGIPNVGKSTLINQWAGRSIAKTGNEPAVTKMQQRIKISDQLALIDTPGILWPKFENQNSAYRLAATGAIKDTAFSYDDIAYFTIDFLQNHYAEELKQRYNLPDLATTELAALEQIGRVRGCLVAGNRVDLNKVGKLLLNDLRSGKIGLISLETPAIAIKEAQQVALILQQKEDEKKAKKAERLAKHKNKM